MLDSLLNLLKLVEILKEPWEVFLGQATLGEGGLCKIPKLLGLIVSKATFEKIFACFEAGLDHLLPVSIVFLGFTDIINLLLGLL